MPPVPLRRPIYWREALIYFWRPVEILRGYRLRDLRADVIAALTVAIVMLPQAIAFALIAELPPQMGLYGAIVASVIGALWGSSHQLQSGPSNTTSLLVLSVLLGVASPGTPEYLAAAGIMALLVGLFRLLAGLARLGMVVNFVSNAVVVGFTAGAGVLILSTQLRHLLRLAIPSSPLLSQTLLDVGRHLAETHWPSLIIGLGTLALIVLLGRINRKLPGPLIAMVAASLLVGVLGLDRAGVRVVGELPRGLPPLARLPLGDLGLINRLLTGSLAVAAIGLVESISISRVISSRTGQRLDSNQEFVGQGLANIAAALFSGYACSGSFTRSAVNYQAGARTGIASALAGVLVLLALLALGRWAAYVPLPALAGVLILTAYGLVDRPALVRIWHSSRGDRSIMVITLLATLALPLEFAVLTGIALSLAVYLIRTSTPRVRCLLPEDDFRHFAYQPDKPNCPQLGVVEILGDLYFGASSHVEARIDEIRARHPEQRFLLLRMHTVERCDISGINTLESIVRAYRERHGDVYLVRVRRPVLELFRASGFYAHLGADHFLGPDEAVGHLFYRVLDPAVCIYECPLRVFHECQNLPKVEYPAPVHLDLPAGDIPAVAPGELWRELRGASPPIVLDVREPREFERGHIPQALSLPLPQLLAQDERLPRDRGVVVVCRGGRRSARAAALLRRQGIDARVLNGGMIAWEGNGMLVAVETGQGENNDPTSLS